MSTKLTIVVPLGPHSDNPRSHLATDRSDSVGRRDTYGYLPAIACENGNRRPAQTAFQRPGPPMEARPEPVRNPYSVSGLQPLQAFIPNDLFPDDLLVYDPDNVTASSLDRMRRPSYGLPVRYVRIFPNLRAPRQPYNRYPDHLQDLKGPPEHFMPPKPAFMSRSSSDPVRTAHLYLKAKNSIGRGHHSAVYSAPLRLRLNPASGEESIVRVAAKTARGSCGAHTMLHVEAGVYDAFPQHLMEGQWHYADAAPASATSPGAAQPDAGPQANVSVTSAPPPQLSPGATAGGERSNVAASAIEFSPAVVPKFFGYYAAIGADGSVITPLHVGCGGEGTCRVSWPTRILLVEECGKPICPQVFSQQQKCVHPQLRPSCGPSPSADVEFALLLAHIN